MNQILLVLPVPFRRIGSTLLFEKQACNGLEHWAEHFDKIELACPVIPDSFIWAEATTMLWRDVQELNCLDRVQITELPWAYKLPVFVRNYTRIRQLLREKIQASHYLSFGIGGLIGDWAAVGCLEAMRLNRSFSVWTDRVEYEVIRRTNAANSLKRRLKNQFFTVPLMKRYHHYLISQSDLGLFHGQDCYEAFAPYSSNPHLVHDVHLKSTDLISTDDLEKKQKRVAADEPLQIVYAGRAADMKGPQDWLEVMTQLRDRGIRFRAVWLGDGPLFDDMNDQVEERQLSNYVEFVGFVADRQYVLQQLRHADLFVFCHKTPESPRCLIEALMSGCLLVGYDSSYPRELAGETAVLTPLNDVAALTEAIVNLNANRSQLAAQLEKSAQIGSHYSDEAVFRQRSELIKACL